MKSGREIWTALTLVLSACVPSIHAHGEPADQVPEAPAFESGSEAMAADHQEPIDPVQTSDPAPTGSPQHRDAPLRDIETPAAPVGVAAQVPTPAVAPGLTPKTSELFTLERGAGNVPLLIPRNESLVFEVHLNLGWIGSPTVGKVTMTSDVRPYLSATPGQPASEQVLISGRAEGSYKVYTLDNTISSALLPQAWPQAIHRNVQTGSECRSRETLLGVIDGKPSSRYRGDGHCKGCKDKAHFVAGTWPWSDREHCKKCKRPEHRYWKEPRTREVPEGTLDMLSAVYLARSLVLDGRQRVEFPLIDRDELWQVQLTRGKTKRIETTAGVFNAVQVELRTGPPEGTPPSEATKFEGLFGIHGTISIWMEAASGVPVQIEGAVSAGPIDLDVTIDLRSARGTPRAFTGQRE